MIINSDIVLSHLAAKVRQETRAPSRHLLCPRCKRRVKLYRLKDGRKKCSACGAKFEMDKQTDETKLRQYADLLLCFTLDFSARKAAELSGYRYKLVADSYMHFRKLLAEHGLGREKIPLLLEIEQHCRGLHENEFCKRCARSPFCKGRQKGDAPVFGVRQGEKGKIILEPLPEKATESSLDQLLQQTGVERFAAYSGFVCKGKFHHFKDRPKQKGNLGLEYFWSWIEERFRKHHGVQNEYLGFYYKELEWKYNHRLLTSEEQAIRIAELFPSDFLQKWLAHRSPNGEGGSVE